jgi:restriction endonuclease Mrr
MSASELQAMLKSCSLHVLLMLTSKALTRSGYGDVQILDRRHTKQKSRFGGHELVCEALVGSTVYRTIVKVVNDVGRLRMLDELVGSVNRMKADRGLLVTPHRLSAAAERARSKYSGVRIDTFAGEALGDLLTKSGIGVRSKGSVDYAFFAAMEDVSERLLTFIEGERP